LGGGNRYITVECATRGAKIDTIIEKRQFPMDFFLKTYNYYSIAHTNRLRSYKWNILKNIIGQNTQFHPLPKQALHSGIDLNSSLHNARPNLSLSSY
jgi:hypothetical protein